MRYLSPSHVVATRRKGVVLLVVMAMLTLFAALGIGFVFYADAVAVAAQTNRASMAKEQAYIDPELTAAYFLNQLMYGVDPNKNPYSAMQGHSMADTLFGYNPSVLNYTPFNGIGRQVYTLSNPANIANLDAVNYTRFESPVGTLADGFYRRPGCYDISTDLTNPPTKYIEGTNVPWTAPDRFNIFLAVMTADGTVLLPSFQRPWIDPNITTVDPTSKSRYLTLRPHGNWHPGFVPNALFNVDPVTGTGGYPYMPDSELVLFGGKKIMLDVRNLDFGIGFSNTSGTISNNDSSWMDLGFPIMTAQNGKRYRPLFAPLIIDISNRLHLWVHGNNLGTTIPHVSGQGWGVSDVNLSTVITNSADLATLFGPRMRGPVPATNAPLGPFGLPGVIPNAPPYAGIDFDGKDNKTGNSIAPFTLPGVSNALMMPFPTYPAGGYENNAAEYAGGMPLGRNIFQPAGRPFPMSEMEWLLRYGGTNIPATTSELARQLPNTFSPLTDTLRRNRNMVTLWSAHLDRIAASPVISFDPYAQNQAPRYTMNSPALIPTLTPPSPLTPLTFSPTPPTSVGGTGGEYSADWRSVLATRMRVNVNRKLTSYPLPDATTGVIDVVKDGATYDQAVADRQALAKDIYQALVRVTGAVDPNVAAAAAVSTPASYNAARWLAQLSVNIVDYIDEDDYMTPWQWDVNSPTNEYVFGTELPRLVINEFYGQFDNFDPADMTPATCKLNIWLELHNPFQTSTGAYPRDGGIAKLVGSDQANPAYKIVVCPSELTLKATDKKLRDPDNNLGVPNSTLSTLSDWGAAGPTQQQVLPANGIFEDTTKKNNGFFVVGPTATFIAPSQDPKLPVTYSTPTTVAMDGTTTGLSITQQHPLPAALPKYTVLLRRLANEHMPYNNTPGARYNPYATVDYIADRTPYDNRLYTENGIIVPPTGIFNAPSLGKAFGRVQPYAANTTQIVQQSPVAANGQPKHTFFRHNSTSKTAPVASGSPPSYPSDGTLNFPFDWLTHLDRPLINPLELLYVSSYRAHELTQQFATVTGAGANFQQIAPWNNQDSMIYRVLDLLMTPNHLLGTYRGGVHPGLINLNTITEKEVLRGVADPNSSAISPALPDFNTADVDAIFSNIVLSRTNNQGAPVLQPLQPQSDGAPFKGFAAGNKEESWLRLGPDNLNKCFDLTSTMSNPPTHAYKRNTLLQKIYNNITPTSNVFAVWWTVGYFEVVDESVRPARLGAEIGRSENRQIRHRFFAIVDRSAMQIYSTSLTANVAAGANQSATINPAISTKTGVAGAYNAAQGYVPGNAVTSGGVTYICIQAISGKDPATLVATDPTITQFWQPALQVGMIVEIAGTNPEAVVVKSVSGNTFTADFQFSHLAADPMFLRGNPGPQATYNPHRDPNVILHMSVIK